MVLQRTLVVDIALKRKIVARDNETAVAALERGDAAEAKAALGRHMNHEKA